MNTKQLAKNIAKPFFIKNIYISNLESFPFSDQNYDIIFNFRLLINSNNDNLNNINMIELIRWFNSFDKIKVIDWDDDKEFDFSNIENIYLSVNFKLFDLLKEKHNYLNDNVSYYLLQHNFNELLKFQKDYLKKISEEMLFRYFLDNEIAEVKIKNQYDNIIS